MREPELIFDQTEEYQRLAKTHDVLAFAMQVIGAILFGFLTLAALSIGGLK